VAGGEDRRRLTRVELELDPVWLGGDPFLGEGEGDLEPVVGPTGPAELSLLNWLELLADRLVEWSLAKGVGGWAGGAESGSARSQLERNSRVAPRHHSGTYLCGSWAAPLLELDEVFAVSPVEFEHIE